MKTFKTYAYKKNHTSHRHLTNALGILREQQQKQQQQQQSHILTDAMNAEIYTQSTSREIMWHYMSSRNPIVTPPPSPSPPPPTSSTFHYIANILDIVLNSIKHTHTHNSYSCYCIDGYTGIQCQTNWDECWSGPCQNGGTCIDGVAYYNCTCPDGFSGTLLFTL
uniref:EGF-like domain-containing protein n=1 Tax=Glossina brevipalpis TaxID=37001 RepID=A0A1A9WEZ1_9MUSC